MARDQHVRRLLEKLLRAIECSLAASEAARDTVEEILRRGGDTAIFFAGVDAGSEVSSGERVELTAQDREFLRTLAIRPDSV